MNLARWEPFRGFLTVHDRMNQLMSEPYLRVGAPLDAVGGWYPAVDIHEDQERIVLRAELPGVGTNDIDVSVEDGTLTLRGEKKQEKQVESEGAFRQERYYGSFSRSFVLPAAIKADAINATYKDGILEVVLPKAEEAKPRKIKIAASGIGAKEDSARR